MVEALVRTDRLNIAPLGLSAIEAILEGDSSELERLTDAIFPHPASPPPYMTDALPVVSERLRAHPDETDWWNWLVVERETRRAMGSVAFGGKPDVDGAVLIGYAMYPEFEGHGYATEAVRAMIVWAFQQPGVKVVRALAPVWNTPAVRVVENVGMHPVAAGEDDDIGEVLVYAVSAPASVESV